MSWSAWEPSRWSKTSSSSEMPPCASFSAVSISFLAFLRLFLTRDGTLFLSTSYSAIETKLGRPSNLNRVEKRSVESSSESLSFMIILSMVFDLTSFSMGLLRSLITSESTCFSILGPSDLIFLAVSRISLELSLLPFFSYLVEEDLREGRDLDDLPLALSLGFAT